MCRQARPVRSRRRRTLLARAGAGARRASSLALVGVDATRVPSGEQWRGGGRGEGGRLCWRAQVLAPVAWQSQRRSQDVPLLARAGAGTRRVQSSKGRGDVADEEVRAGGLLARAGAGARRVQLPKATSRVMGRSAAHSARRPPPRRPARIPTHPNPLRWPVADLQTTLRAQGGAKCPQRIKWEGLITPSKISTLTHTAT